MRAAARARNLALLREALRRRADPWAPLMTVDLGRLLDADGNPMSPRLVGLLLRELGWSRTDRMHQGRKGKWWFPAGGGVRRRPGRPRKQPVG